MEDLLADLTSIISSLCARLYGQRRAKRKINADVNGSYNIMRKAFPNVFRNNGVEDGKGFTSLVVHPVRVVIPLMKPKKASDQ